MDKLITREYLLGLIKGITYTRRGTTTICTLDIDGFEVTGESHCAFKEQYSKKIGEKVSYENALRQLRLYEQYAVRKTVNAEC